MKKIAFIIIFGIFLSGFLPVAFADNSRGIITGAIWYSETELKEGESVKIYTAVWNPESENLTGTVIFNDKNTVLGKKDFIAQPETLEEVFIEWKIPAGEHAISARITNTRVTKTDGGTRSVSLSETETPEYKFFVSKKIVPAEKTGEKESDIKSLSLENSTEDENKDSGSLLSKAENIVSEHTPEFLKPATDSLENFRLSTAEKLENKKESFKKEIEEAKVETQTNPVEKDEKTSVKSDAKSAVAEEKIDSEKKESKETIGKASPMAYAGFFFSMLGSYIFSHGILFYIILAVIVFFILRFIYKRIFN